jgi:hypothetical protein
MRIKEKSNIINIINEQTSKINKEKRNNTEYMKQPEKDPK